jgi:mRNA interferase MazF
MKRGDVYEAQLSPTEGSEQAGIRPVIIVSRDAINTYSPVIVIVPLTNRIHVTRDYPNNVVIQKGESGLTVDSVALGGQVRAIAKSRLRQLRGTLSVQTMQSVDRAVKITLDL